MTELIKRIASRIGFPFGIRGTASSYFKSEGALPKGTTNGEGLNGITTKLHFFVVDQKSLDRFRYEDIDVMLERTVAKAVQEYSKIHSNGLYWNFLEGVEKKALPMVYVFSAGYEYCRDRYSGQFSELEGKPTFPEADSGDKEIDSKGIFTTTEEDYEKKNPSARSWTRILVPTIRVDDATGDAYFRDQNLDSVVHFFEAMYDYQRNLGTAVPREYRFKKPRKREVKELLQVENSFLSRFNKAYLMNFAANIYLDALYKGFAEKIISDMRKNFV